MDDDRDLELLAFLTGAEFELSQFLKDKRLGRDDLEDEIRLALHEYMTEEALRAISDDPGFQCIWVRHFLKDAQKRSKIIKAKLN